ncbi:hypothetical protein AB6D11_00525 [Vibrio splendidus]
MINLTHRTKDAVLDLSQARPNFLGKLAVAGVTLSAASAVFIWSNDTINAIERETALSSSYVSKTAQELLETDNFNSAYFESLSSPPLPSHAPGVRINPLTDKPYLYLNKNYDLDLSVRHIAKEVVAFNESENSNNVGLFKSIKEGLMGGSISMLVMSAKEMPSSFVAGQRNLIHPLRDFGGHYGEGEDRVSYFVRGPQQDAKPSLVFKAMQLNEMKIHGPSRAVLDETLWNAWIFYHEMGHFVMYDMPEYQQAYDESYQKPGGKLLLSQLSEGVADVMAAQGMLNHYWPHLQFEDRVDKVRDMIHTSYFKRSFDTFRHYIKEVQDNVRTQNTHFTQDTLMMADAMLIRDPERFSQMTAKEVLNHVKDIKLTNSKTNAGIHNQVAKLIIDEESNTLECQKPLTADNYNSAAMITLSATTGAYIYANDIYLDNIKFGQAKIVDLMDSAIMTDKLKSFMENQKGFSVEGIHKRECGMTP